MATMNLINLYAAVKKQHKHFNLLYEGPPKHLIHEEKVFYHACLIEEANEYEEAETLEDEFDALLDLTVFTLGAMQRHGFDPDGIMEVVKANMKKQIGPNTKRGSFQLDLFKPEGWKAPDLSAFL
jgi:predicted HAD superfamily Cof-like phosphohydrolase